LGTSAAPWHPTTEGNRGQRKLIRFSCYRPDALTVTASGKVLPDASQT
jgi:hypothetical protein